MEMNFRMTSHSLLVYQYNYSVRSLPGIVRLGIGEGGDSGDVWGGGGEVARVPEDGISKS